MQWPQRKTRASEQMDALKFRRQNARGDQVEHVGHAGSRGRENEAKKEKPPNQMIGSSNHHERYLVERNGASLTHTVYLEKQ